MRFNFTVQPYQEQGVSSQAYHEPGRIGHETPDFTKLNDVVKAGINLYQKKQEDDDAALYAKTLADAFTAQTRNYEDYSLTAKGENTEEALKHQSELYDNTLIQYRNTFKTQKYRDAFDQALYKQKPNYMGRVLENQVNLRGQTYSKQVNDSLQATMAYMLQGTDDLTTYEAAKALLDTVDAIGKTNGMSALTIENTKQDLQKWLVIARAEGLLSTNPYKLKEMLIGEPSALKDFLTQENTKLAIKAKADGTEFIPYTIEDYISNNDLRAKFAQSEKAPKWAVFYNNMDIPTRIQYLNKANKAIAAIESTKAKENSENLYILKDDYKQKIKIEADNAKQQGDTGIITGPREPVFYGGKGFDVPLGNYNEPNFSYTQKGGKVLPNVQNFARGLSGALDQKGFDVRVTANKENRNYNSKHNTGDAVDIVPYKKGDKSKKFNPIAAAYAVAQASNLYGDNIGKIIFEIKPDHWRDLGYAKEYGNDAILALQEIVKQYNLDDSHIDWEQSKKYSQSNSKATGAHVHISLDSKADYTKARFQGIPGTLSKIPGQIKQGNIAWSSLPVHQNEDGSISTMKTKIFGINLDGKDVQVLLPSIEIIKDKNNKTIKKDLTDEEILAKFKKDKQHLGMFETVEAAESYDEVLHKTFPQFYGVVLYQNNLEKQGTDIYLKEGDSLLTAAYKSKVDFRDNIQKEAFLRNFKQNLFVGDYTIDGGKTYFQRPRNFYEVVQLASKTNSERRKLLLKSMPANSEERDALVFETFLDDGIIDDWIKEAKKFFDAGDITGYVKFVNNGNIPDDQLKVLVPQYQEALGISSDKITTVTKQEMEGFATTWLNSTPEIKYQMMKSNLKNSADYLQFISILDEQNKSVVGKSARILKNIDKMSQSDALEVIDYYSLKEADLDAAVKAHLGKGVFRKYKKDENIAYDIQNKGISGAYIANLRASQRTAEANGYLNDLSGFVKYLLTKNPNMSDERAFARTQEIFFGSNKTAISVKTNENNILLFSREAVKRPEDATQIQTTLNSIKDIGIVPDMIKKQLPKDFEKLANKSALEKLFLDNNVQDALRQFQGANKTLYFATTDDGAAVGVYFRDSEGKSIPIMNNEGKPIQFSTVELKSLYDAALEEMNHYKDFVEEIDVGYGLATPYMVMAHGPLISQNTIYKVKATKDTKHLSPFLSITPFLAPYNLIQSITGHKDNIVQIDPIFNQQDTETLYLTENEIFTFALHKVLMDKYPEQFGMKHKSLIKRTHEFKPVTGSIRPFAKYTIIEE